MVSHDGRIPRLEQIKGKQAQRRWCLRQKLSTVVRRLPPQRGRCLVRASDAAANLERHPSKHSWLRDMHWSIVPLPVSPVKTKQARRVIEWCLICERLAKGPAAGATLLNETGAHQSMCLCKRDPNAMNYRHHMYHSASRWWTSTLSC